METILDAVVLVLKRHGIDAVTTNRIAEVAGVSIGSVYQYFPDKRAIFDALHDRPVEAIGRVIDGVLVAHAASSLADFVRGLVEALVDAHASDAEFHQLMTTTVPHGAAGANALAERLRAVFRIAITSRAQRRPPRRELERSLFVLSHMVEALAHGAAYGRPPRVSATAAKEEAVHAVLAYLRS